jgi:parallel beta-helix repeat protein
MMNRIIAGTMLTLLLVVMFVAALNTQIVKAELGTIYIRANGSIDPPDAPISTVDNVTYVLTGNITSDSHGIVVLRSNIIIDGAGYTLQCIGALSTGIDVESGSNVTIKNAKIKGFDSGISFFGNTPALKFSNVVGNYIANCSYGILGGGFSYNIAGNNIINNTWGVKLFASSNNTIVGNNITANDKGITLWGESSNNSVFGNNIESNFYGIMLVYGSSNNKIFHNNFINNTRQADSVGYNNPWDDGYPSGGNYWSDYAGADVNSDGIGDTPYVIDADNQDRYPLMHSWSSLPVHNINTGLGYDTIQEAINANETLDRHTIFVEAGTYHENVVVNKTVSIIGESRATTFIDGNRTAEAVVITANNTMLSEFTIQSSDSFIVAVRLENVSHAIIMDNTITNSLSGLVLAFSDSNTIAGNNITKNTFRDAFVNSSNNFLTDNSMEGLYISKSINNTLMGNTIGSFMLSYSLDTTLRNNSFSVFGIYGETLSHFVQNTDSSNTISGKPVYYWVNRENSEVPSDAGYVALINCVNITVRGSNFENNFQSILMFSTNNSRILNNNVTNINEGIWVSSSSNNIIYENIIANNSVGIQLINECSDNNIHGNNITANGLGIWLARSSSNRIFHNNFVSNVNQVNSYKSINTWDDDYPSGGNYWSDYNGTDANHDGIGDTSYVIDANNTDHYPLMTSYIIPEFPIFLILPLFMLVTLLAVMVYTRKDKISDVM